jgi:hypothetical protein
MPFAKKFNVLNKPLVNKNNVSVKPLRRKSKRKKNGPQNLINQPIKNVS